MSGAREGRPPLSATQARGLQRAEHGLVLQPLAGGHPLLQQGRLFAFPVHLAAEDVAIVRRVVVHSRKVSVGVAAFILRLRHENDKQRPCNNNES